MESLQGLKDDFKKFWGSTQSALQAPLKATEDVWNKIARSTEASPAPSPMSSPSDRKQFGSRTFFDPAADRANGFANGGTSLSFSPPPSPVKVKAKTSAEEEEENAEFADFNFWRVPPPALDERDDSEDFADVNYWKAPMPTLDQLKL